MGQAHILFVYEDGLRYQKEGDFNEVLGAAVREVCDPLAEAKARHLDSNRQVVQGTVHAAVGPATNCVNKAATVDAMFTEVFVWKGNRLAKFDQLTPIEMEDVRRRLECEVSGLASTPPAIPNIRQWDNLGEGRISIRFTRPLSNVELEALPKFLMRMYRLPAAPEPGTVGTVPHKGDNSLLARVRTEAYALEQCLGEEDQRTAALLRDVERTLVALEAGAAPAVNQAFIELRGRVDDYLSSEATEEGGEYTRKHPPAWHDLKGAYERTADAAELAEEIAQSRAAPSRSRPR